MDGALRCLRCLRLLGRFFIGLVILFLDLFHLYLFNLMREKDELILVRRWFMVNQVARISPREPKILPPLCPKPLQGRIEKIVLLVDFKERQDSIERCDHKGNDKGGPVDLKGARWRPDAA